MSNRLKGIAAIVFSAFGFALMATLVRLSDDFGGELSAFQKGFFRNLIAVAIAAFFYCRRQNEGLSLKLPRREAFVLFLRALLGTVGIFANFYALSHIPIAEGFTLNKTAPFFTVVFAGLFLRERPSLRQLSALALAFAGVLLIAKPGFAGAATVPLALGLISGMCAGGAYACVRELCLRKVNPSFIILFFSVFSCLSSLPFLLIRFDAMTFTQFFILLGAGGAAAMGQFGITLAYRFAEPRQIAVFDYTGIVFSGLLGLCFFNQIPDILSLVGFATIIAAGLWMRK